MAARGYSAGAVEGGGDGGLLPDSKNQGRGEECSESEATVPGIQSNLAEFEPKDRFLGSPRKSTRGGETQDRQGGVRLLAPPGPELINDQPKFGSKVLESHVSPKAQSGRMKRGISGSS
jgi:hypothetical protein